MPLTNTLANPMKNGTTLKNSLDCILLPAVMIRLEKISQQPAMNGI